jgi:hypothetical protein
MHLNDKRASSLIYCTIERVSTSSTDKATPPLIQIAFSRGKVEPKMNAMGHLGCEVGV